MSVRDKGSIAFVNYRVEQLLKRRLRKWMVGPSIRGAARYAAQQAGAQARSVSAIYYELEAGITSGKYPVMPRHTLETVALAIAGRALTASDIYELLRKVALEREQYQAKQSGAFTRATRGSLNG